MTGTERLWELHALSSCLFLFCSFIKCYFKVLLQYVMQGLRLFNLDIIREHGTKDRYYVIDINYFPGKLRFHL